MRARRHGLWFGLWIAACASQPAPASDSEATARAGVPSSGTAAASGAQAGSAAAPASVTARAGTGAALANTVQPAAAGTTARALPANTAAGSTGGAGAGAAGASGGSGAGPAGAGASQNAAGSGALAGTTARAGSGGMRGIPAAGSGDTTGAHTPLYRVPLRVHVQDSKLSDADLGPVFEELNSIWQKQAGICFDIEVVTSDANRSDGFDFRYTAGRIPGATSANGLTQNAHAIWSIDHPQLNAAPHPVMNPTARTTAHELGHALGLAHENPPPSNDCSSPCYCAERGDDCDDYLLRSGTKGYFLSPPEIDITRKQATKAGKADPAATSCAAPVFMR